MEQIIQSILLGVLIILEFILFFVLVATAAPQILKNHCVIRQTSDRGIKKYLYPNGRAVVYEPHPSFRKYLSQYLLFTEDGYKYVRCKLDAGVESIRYAVVMFNNRNRVVDVIDVEEKKILSDETTPVRLHPDTSYIALIPDEVNHIKIKHDAVMSYHVWQLAAYAAVVGGLGFAQMLFITKMVRVYDTWWIHSGIVDAITTESFILPAIVIGVLAGFMAERHHRKKGVRWSK